MRLSTKFPAPTWHLKVGRGPGNKCKPVCQHPRNYTDTDLEAENEILRAKLNKYQAKHYRYFSIIVYNKTISDQLSLPLAR